MLRRDEHRAGRKHVVTLIKKMGIEALYKKPATSRRHPEHAVYPYLLRAMQIKAGELRLGCRYQLYSDEALVEHADGRFLY